MKTKLAFILLWASLLITSACSINQNKEKEVWLANPASVYCEENWWKLELMSDEKWNYGICYFSNGNFCEEREFYRGECNPSLTSTWSTKNNEIIDFKTCMDAWNPIMESYPRKCRFKETTFTEDIKNINWEKSSEVVCAMDAKQCPDWNYVGRVWPNCQFAPCTTDSNIPDNTKDIQNLIDDHKKNNITNNTWLIEEDIELMEAIIDKIK